MLWERGAAKGCFSLNIWVRTLREARSSHLPTRIAPNTQQEQLYLVLTLEWTHWRLLGIPPRWETSGSKSPNFRTHGTSMTTWWEQLNGSKGPLADSWRGYSPQEQGGGQKNEAVGHTVSTVGKQRSKCSGLFLCTQSKTPNNGTVPPQPKPNPLQSINLI